MKKIEYFMSHGSPWTFLGHKRINKIASENELKGILGIEFNPLVSIDFLNDTRSSIIDAQSTLVTDNNLLKVYSWYDNETGYACRMNDIVKLVHNSLNV